MTAIELDYDRHPLVVWEVTRACGLHCQHCPMGADTQRSPLELSTYEGYKTIDQIATIDPSRFVISGGDPFERDDIFQFVEYAKRRGLDPAVALSPTSEVTPQAVAMLARKGASRIVMGLDDATAVRHDAVRGIPGTFAATLDAARWAREAGIAVEINTLVSRRNASHLAEIVGLLDDIAGEAWNLYFLVPVGGAKNVDVLTAEEVERVFAFIDGAAGAIKVRVIEAPHYRRHRLQKLSAERQRMVEADQWADFAGYESGDDTPVATHDARGVVFVSHSGEVRPSEFLPLSAGNIRYRALGAIFRGGDLFVALRDPRNLKGKCSRCEYARVCGGSRARAFAVTGDLFASDPLCAYEPAH
jgi:radical SAM protein with 4Fe4S-binding SPASM domain